MGLLRLLQGRMAHRVISCRVFIAFGNVSLGTAIGKLPMEESVVKSVKAPKIGRPNFRYPYPQPGRIPFSQFNSLNSIL